MRQITILFIILAGLTIQSCQDNFDVQKPVGRSYQQDAEVLNKFVDINKTTHEYYINPNKRNTALSYITNADAEELNDVNPANLNLFKQSVGQVSSLAGQLAASRGADYIVMVTERDIYISQIKSDSPIELRCKLPDSRNYHPTIASMKVTGETEEYDVYGNTIETFIELHPFSYKNAGWSFWVNCEIGNNNDKETVRVLFCGVGFNINPRFEWCTVQSHGLNQNWHFEVTGGSDNDHFSIAQLNFSQP